MKERLTQRDLFECEYIHKHMPDYVYAESKDSLERLRNGLKYDDEHVAEEYKNWEGDKND